MGYCKVCDSILVSEQSGLCPDCQHDAAMNDLCDWTQRVWKRTPSVHLWMCRIRRLSPFQSRSDAGAGQDEAAIT